jgi:Tfp pilus assembly protein PilX
MNTNNRIHRNRQGSTLLAVLGYLFLATGLVATILALSSTHRKISQRQVNIEQAMFVAEGGMERGARFMESNVVAIVTSASGATNGNGSIGSGTYTFAISRTNSSTYNIVCTGTVNNVSRTVSLQRIYQPTYAEFALWSQTNGAIYFVNGEVFYGHVHADDKLYFDVNGGGPVFHAAVTSNAGTYSIKGGSISAVTFDEGLTLNSYQGTMADVNFNDSTKANCLKDIATSSGLVLDGNTTITFNGGTLSIINTRAGWSTAHTYDPPTEGIIYIKNSNTGSTSTRAGVAYLKGGTLNGRLTIVSETNMYIQGNITYVSNPVSNPNSDDALGLVSGSDINVDTMAPNDLTVYAALMAAGSFSGGDLGSFTVINYNSGSPRGDLTIYGGIVQELRGPVGQTSGGSPLHGYTKNYSYDPRFIENPPPYYPIISSQVRFSQWKEGH